MQSYLVMRRNAWRAGVDLERAASRSSRVESEEMAGRVRWIRTYVCTEEDGSLGSVCVYQAQDAQAVAEHARRAGLGCDAILPIVRAVVISDDPIAFDATETNS